MISICDWFGFGDYWTTDWTMTASQLAFVLNPNANIEIFQQ